jgi:biopolymer transport protein TolQ
LFDPTTITSAAPPGPFKGTIYQMITGMGTFAQMVLLVLLFLSVISWAITIYKILLYRRVNADTNKFLATFRRRRSIREVYLSCVGLKKTPLSPMLEAGFKELEEIGRTDKNPHKDREAPLVVEFGPHPHKDRLDVVRMTLERVGSEEINRLEKSNVFLATTGNISPFFGLLGTVWGIMDSFASIGVRGSASLAVVAPGIAEALIATVVGLAVAIPAVMAYNFFNNQLKVFSTQVDNFSLEFLSAVKKEELAG